MKSSPSAGTLRALAAASVLVPMLFLAFGAWLSYGQHMREAEGTVRRATEVLTEQALRVFEVQDLVISRVDERVQGMSWDEIAASEDLHLWLKRIDDNLPLIDVIWLIDPAAQGRASSRFFPGPPTSRVPDRDYFKALSAADAGTYIGEPRAGRSTPDRLFFNVARRRSAPDGRFDGLIVTSLDPTYFADAFRALALSPGDSFSIIREDGTILARGPQLLAQATRLTSESGLMRAIRAGREASYRSVAQIDGIERLYGNRKVPGLPIYVSYGRSMDAVLAAWRRDLALYSLLAALAATALLGITYLAKHQTRLQTGAMRRLQESEARYHALFHESPLGLLLTHVDPDGGLAFEEMNPALVAITGFRREDVLERSPAEAFPGDLGRTVEARYRECIATRKPVEYEVEGEGPSGRYVRRAIVRPILDANGCVTKLLGTSMDITQARKLEDQLRRSQKMEALASLVSGVAHDFNNLLTVVMGNLDLLRRAAEERKPRLIENAIRAVEQGRKLTGQLLAFGRRQALQPEVVELPRLMAATQDMLTQSLRGDIELRLDLAEDLWPVRADLSQLQVALINLAANARDAMPKGGTFTLAAENLALGGDRSIEAVALSVSDTGVGIPREALARVFEPFFTTKDVGQGSGLGLAQVYGFAQQSGGSVDVRSEPGRGTTVTLYLPRAERDAPVQADMSRPEALGARPPRPLRILFVEDNPDVAEVGRSILAERGHVVTAAPNVEAALASLESTAFDLVCSDLVMPGGAGGLDLARTVRDRWPGLPLVLVTGYSDAAGEARAEGFTLLQKPYQPEDLLAAVETAPADPGDKVVHLSERARR
ncbi:MAG TPA: ATP-binding protein [Microvirga sp.]|jgi:PAS domain S-box-containing protein|nr:ATP-binding protein [Microvirga sp.]